MAGCRRMLFTGFSQLEYRLSEDAMDLGLDAALPPVIELGSKIAEFGRGERSRAENSDACQTIRFVRRNEGRSSGSQPGEMSARPLRSSPCRVKAPRGCRWHSNPHRQTRRLSDLAGGATDRSRRGANAVGPSEPGERAEADYRPTLCHGNPSHGAGARELTVSGVPARTGRRDTRFRDCQARPGPNLLGGWSVGFGERTEQTMQASSRQSAALDDRPSVSGGSIAAQRWGPPSGARPALVERARGGDREAFEALIDPWIEPAFRTAMAILGNEADARDATQDALLNAWRGIRGLHDPERFDAWLGRIHANACRSIGRRRSRSGVREIPMNELPIADDPPNPAIGLADDAAQLDELERAVARLSVEQRTVLVLHHLDHRPVADMARILAVPEGTVKWRLHAAREALARSLEEERR